jgi:hypothetical protein
MEKAFVMTFSTWTTKFQKKGTRKMRKGGPCPNNVVPHVVERIAVIIDHSRKLLLFP